MQFPVIIGLHRSFLLDRLLLLVVLASVVFIGFYPGEPWQVAGLLVVVVLLVGLAWRQLRPPFAALRLTHDGRVEGRLQEDGEFVALRCLPGATVHRWLTVLHLAPESGGAASVLVVTVDSSGPDEFRRLRVFLRWQNRVSASGDVA
ncbi:protein YgfX [Azonexus hydrophilus]|uniref:protein YgfX n=1 Tax=Azonexus hydrophilus TaxID=418702 RepID=UPI00041B83F1|nr:protein YgfX [Azonexus hydrophilus]